MKTKASSAKPQQPKTRNLPPADDKKVKGGYIRVKMEDAIISSYNV